MACNMETNNHNVDNEYLFRQSFNLNNDNAHKDGPILTALGLFQTEHIQIPMW